MKFIFIFSVIFSEIILIDFFEIPDVIRTFGIDAFVHDEMLTVFLWNERMSTVRASELEG